MARHLSLSSDKVRTEFPTDRVLALLSETEVWLAGISDDATAAQLRAEPGPGQWSPTDVLAHLRACSDVWGEAMVRILAEDMPTIRAINPTTWINQTDYRDAGFQSSLQAFVAQRSELLSRLSGISPGAWSRSATLTGAGSPLIRTVHTYAERLAIHERSHRRPFQRLLDAVRR